MLILGFVLAFVAVILVWVYFKHRVEAQAKFKAEVLFDEWKKAELERLTIGDLVDRANERDRKNLSREP